MAVVGHYTRTRPYAGTAGNELQFNRQLDAADVVAAGIPSQDASKNVAGYG